MLAKIHHRKFLIRLNTCDTSPADLEIFSDNLQGSTKAFIGLILLEDILILHYSQKLNTPLSLPLLIKTETLRGSTKIQSVLILFFPYLFLRLKIIFSQTFTRKEVWRNCYHDRW